MHHEEEEEEEEEEEMPEDFKDLDVETRTSRAIQRSLMMMFGGTVIVLAFSDPMVNVLSRFGEISTIPGF